MQWGIVIIISIIIIIIIMMAIITIIITAHWSVVSNGGSVGIGGISAAARDALHPAKPSNQI